MHENYDLIHTEQSEHSTCMPEMVMSMCSVYLCVVKGFQTTDTLPGKAGCGIVSLLCYIININQAAFYRVGVQAGAARKHTTIKVQINGFRR